MHSGHWHAGNARAFVHCYRPTRKRASPHPNNKQLTQQDHALSTCTAYTRTSISIPQVATFAAQETDDRSETLLVLQCSPCSPPPVSARSLAPHHSVCKHLADSGFGKWSRNSPRHVKNHNQGVQGNARRRQRGQSPTTTYMHSAFAHVKNAGQTPSARLAVTKQPPPCPA